MIKWVETNRKEPNKELTQEELMKLEKAEVSSVRCSVKIISEGKNMLTIFIGMLDSDEAKDKLTAIYEKYYGTMLSVAKGIIPDHALAEDAVSDSIMTIIKNLHKITDISCHKTKAYIVIIVRNCAIDLLRKQKNHLEELIDDFDLPDNNPSMLDALSAKESFDRIVSHIRALPKSLSDALYLSVVLEHSNEEIAKLLNISNDAVRQRLSRGKAKIKIKLAQEGIEYAKK